MFGKSIMTKQAATKTLYLAVVMLLMIGVGWYGHGWYDRASTSRGERRVTLKGFEYISPLVDVELPEGYSVRREPIPFKHTVEKYVDQLVKSGAVKDISVYFRDLSDGPWFGINEDVKYNAASMMKVSTMIAWLKRAEKDPSVLRRTFVFDEKAYDGPPQVVAPERTLKSGRSYTVDELLNYMMNFSDNKAMWLLHNDLHESELRVLLDSMDVTNDTTTGYNLITVHGYSGFLRVLYNASYLNKEMSERALKLMSYQEFPQGIVAGIPKGVKVASKYGVINDGVNRENVQLHEFGIVYHPNGPYILGILSRGNNLDVQANVLKTVSEMVYKSVLK